MTDVKVNSPLYVEHGMHEVAQVIVAPRVQNTMTEPQMCDSDPAVSVFTCEEERTIDKGGCEKNS